MTIRTFSASGKLLLFGEYLVLRGAKCFAMPLNAGQQLVLQQNEGKGIRWQCFEENKNCWLEVALSNELAIISSNSPEKAAIVQKLLQYIDEKQPDLVFENLDFKFKLSFNRQFGFGTSATFISLISQWSGVDPYELLAHSFGGSGYDIATATSGKPLIYSTEKKVERFCNIHDSITKNLLFIYLGKKQTSSKEIALFNHKATTDDQIETMNSIVAQATECQEIFGWEKLMNESEQLLCSLLHYPMIKEDYFRDYPFAIKSLGAWGGDFIMATCRNIEEGKRYFKYKGLKVSFTFAELIK